MQQGLEVLDSLTLQEWKAHKITLAKAFRDTVVEKAHDDDLAILEATLERRIMSRNAYVENVQNEILEDLMTGEKRQRDKTDKAVLFDHVKDLWLLERLNSFKKNILTIRSQ